MEELAVTPLADSYTPEYLDYIRSLPKMDLGRLKDPEDDRDYSYSEKIWEPPSELFPKRVDELRHSISAIDPDMPDLFSRRNHTGAVLDQALTSECVTHSGASLRDEQERKEHRRDYTANVHEWYNSCKEIDPWPGQDGTGIRFAAQIAKTKGVRMFDARSSLDDPDGRFFKISAYVRLNSLAEILDCIYRKNIVWYGNEISREWFVPLYTDKGPVIGAPSESVGGHAVALSGFWLSQGWLEVKNSWSEAWGAGGYAWLPISHLSHFPDWDAWTTVDEKSLYG